MLAAMICKVCMHATMALDLPTLMIVSVLLSLGIAVGFSLILLLLPRERVLQLWTGSLWLLALALAVVSAQIWLPVRWTVVVSNTCMALANALLIHGVAIHVGAKRQLRLLALGVGGYVLTISWFALVRPDFDVRLHVFSLASIACDGWIVFLLLRCPALDIRRSCRLAALAFAFHGALYLCQLTCLPVHADAAGSIRHGGMAVAGFYVILLLLILAKCFAMLLLIVERLMAGLRRMARLDGLTGLLNHHTVLGDGRLLLEQARRRRCPVTVLLCDLDHFKLINDTWGHQAGDRVLKHVAGLIEDVLAGGGHLASRYGGEEFLLVLLDCDVGQALAVAERLRRRIGGGPVSWPGASIQVTTSIGLSLADTDSTFEQIIARADAALYCSKREGRNRASISGREPA